MLNKVRSKILSKRVLSIIIPTIYVTIAITSIYLSIGFKIPSILLSSLILISLDPLLILTRTLDSKSIKNLYSISLYLYISVLIDLLKFLTILHITIISFSIFVLEAIFPLENNWLELLLNPSFIILTYIISIHIARKLLLRGTKSIVCLRHLMLPIPSREAEKTKIVKLYFFGVEFYAIYIVSYYLFIINPLAKMITSDSTTILTMLRNFGVNFIFSWITIHKLILIIILLLKTINKHRIILDTINNSVRFQEVCNELERIIERPYKETY